MAFHHYLPWRQNWGGLSLHANTTAPWVGCSGMTLALESSCHPTTHPHQCMNHWESAPPAIFSNCSPNHIKLSKFNLSSYRVICFPPCIAGCVFHCNPYVCSHSNALGLRRGLNWIIWSKKNKSNGITQQDQIKVSCFENTGFGFMLAERTSIWLIPLPSPDPHTKAPVGGNPPSAPAEAKVRSC